MLGDPGRIWITAEQQEVGRARRGRQWTSDPGNLYASCLLVDPAERAHLATLPFVAALALFDALVHCAPDIEARLRVKWPNDLLLDGKKMSGILLEASTTPNGRNAVVIGFGVNCRVHPAQTLYPSTSLMEAGYSIGSQELFGALAQAFAERLRIWAQGAGFSIIRHDWRERAAGIGEEIIVRFENSELKGSFVDIEQDGLLLLKLADGSLKRISTADIFFATPAQSGA